MAFLDDIKNSIHEFANASDGMVKRSGDLLEIQKVRIQIGNLETDLRNMYAQVGEYFIENCDRSTLPEEFNNILIRIDECKEAKAQLNERIAAIKGVTVCQGCGKEVPDDALFCPNCGTKIEKKEPEVEPEAETPEEVVEGSEEPSEKSAEESEEKIDSLILVWGKNLAGFLPYKTMHAFVRFPSFRRPFLIKKRSSS
jgi:chaperonin cofactor prefoldin